MKFIVREVFTEVCADYGEISIINDLSVIKEDDEEKSLLRITDNGLYFYSGLVDYFLDKLKSRNIEVEVEYKVSYEDISIHIPEDILPGITLRDYQLSAATKCLHYKRGVVDICTGGGKTEVEIALAKYLNKRTVIFSSGVKPMKQIAKRFEKYGINVGCYWSGEHNLGNNILIGVTNSLRRGIQQGDTELVEYLRDCEVLIIDETHHLLHSKEWQFITESIPAKYRFGFSATPFDNLKEFTFADHNLIGMLGGVICHIPAWVLIERGLLARPIIVMKPINFPLLNPRTSDWHYVYPNGIVNNVSRNNYAVCMAKQLESIGHKVLILVTRHAHGHILLHKFADPNIKFLSGGETVTKYESKGKLVDINEDTDISLSDLLEMKSGIFIGTVVLDEAVDIPDISCLIVLSAQRNYRKVMQRIGRSLRPKPGSNETLIIDFFDKTHYTLTNQSRARIEVYEHDSCRYRVVNSIEEANIFLTNPINLTEEC